MGVLIFLVCAMSNAPSFDDARETLAGLLDDWVFGTVTSVKVPDPANEYYHGVVKTSRGRAWFQQTKSARRPQKFGPVTMSTPRETPKVGDVLMGRADTSARVRLTNWYSDARPMRELAAVCVNGTSKREFQLLGDMRTTHDDVWALCRLIMFGNVQVFSDAHLDGTKPMNLSMPPLEFVYATSTALCDTGLWDAFVGLVPTAEPPMPEVESMWEAPSTVPALMRALPDLAPSYEPYTPDLAYEQPGAYTPESPPYIPGSPPYIPGSPPYIPGSPPYIPGSPPESPTPDPTESKPIDIAALSYLISQYCPPVIETGAYDPANPSY